MFTLDRTVLFLYVVFEMDAVCFYRATLC